MNSATTFWYKDPLIHPCFEDIQEGRVSFHGAECCDFCRMDVKLCSCLPVRGFLSLGNLFSCFFGSYFSSEISWSAELWIGDLNPHGWGWLHDVQSQNDVWGQMMKTLRLCLLSFAI